MININKMNNFLHLFTWGAYLFYFFLKMLIFNLQFSINKLTYKKDGSFERKLNITLLLKTFYGFLLNILWIFLISYSIVMATYKQTKLSGGHFFLQIIIKTWHLHSVLSFLQRRDPRFSFSSSGTLANVMF